MSGSITLRKHAHDRWWRFRRRPAQLRLSVLNSTFMSDGTVHPPFVKQTERGDVVIEAMYMSTQPPKVPTYRDLLARDLQRLHRWFLR